MRTFDRTMTRDDRETEVEVTFGVISWGAPASYWHPAEPFEVEIQKVTTPEGEPVQHTDAEDARWCSEFEQDPPEDDYGPDD